MASTCIYNLQVQIRKLFIPLFLFLAACSANTPEQILPPGTPTAGAATAVIAPTHAPPPTMTSTPGALPTATPTSRPTTTPTEVTILCSPLEIHPLEELPEIIGDAYDPPRPGREERHHGIDFGYYHYQERDSMLGEPVQSVLAGQVAAVLTGQYPYGNMVMIETIPANFPDSLSEEIEIPDGQLALCPVCASRPTANGGSGRPDSCLPIPGRSRDERQHRYPPPAYRNPLGSAGPGFRIHALL